MPRFLVADMQSDGHHARYIRWILQAPYMQEVKPILAGPRSLFEHSEVSDLSDRFVRLEVDITPETRHTIDNASSIWGLWKRQCAYRSLYARAVKLANAMAPLDMVFIAYTDHALDAWALLGTGFGDCPWFGINMHSVFHLGKMPGIVSPHRKDAFLRELLFRRLLRRKMMRKMLTIDPAMPEYVCSFLPPAEAQKVVYLPDPSVLFEQEPCAASRAELGIPPEAFTVLLYGALTPRKGVRELILAADSAQCPTHVHLLIAGRQDADVQEIMASAEARRLTLAGRLHCIEGYLDDNLERTVIRASQAMWIGYVDFYKMSAMLVLAVRNGLPSIFTCQGIIGYLGRKHRLGVEMDPHRIETAVAALNELASHFSEYRHAVCQAQVAFANHSIENQQKILSQTCREVAGSLAAGGRS